MVERFERMTGAGTYGATAANRYKMAGTTSPSPKFGPEACDDCRALSSVVKSAAKYAVGDGSVFCSRNVASSARRRVAGAFW